MADGQQCKETAEISSELKKPKALRNIPVTEEELREQQTSFAFGLCRSQYDVTELAIGPPQSPCNAAPGVERQDQQPESNGEQSGE